MAPEGCGGRGEVDKTILACSLVDSVSIEAILAWLGLGLIELFT